MGGETSSIMIDARKSMKLMNRTFEELICLILVDRGQIDKNSQYQTFLYDDLTSNAEAAANFFMKHKLMLQDSSMDFTKIKWTQYDDEIYKEFRELFPHQNASLIGDLKSSDKEKFRSFFDKWKN